MISRHCAFLDFSRKKQSVSSSPRTTKKKYLYKLVFLWVLDFNVSIIMMDQINFYKNTDPLSHHLQFFCNITFSVAIFILEICFQDAFFCTPWTFHCIQHTFNNHAILCGISNSSYLIGTHIDQKEWRLSLA